MASRKREADAQQEAVAQAISSLELGIPERVARASRRADGASTPVPPYADQHLDSELAIESANLFVYDCSEREEATQISPVEPEASSSAQVITPWDVQGGFVDGKQVSH